MIVTRVSTPTDTCDINVLKTIHIPLTTISMGVEVAEAIDGSKKPGETQSQVISRVLVTAEKIKE